MHAPTRLLDEVHRYFPEWADRPDSGDSLLEADHNSYLACGYSEEFGYRVRPDRAPVSPLLFEDPEHNRQWAVQIGCLHPGYPECPRPAARESGDAIGGDGHSQRPCAGLGSQDRMSLPASRPISEALIRVVRVSRSGTEGGVLSSIAALRARLRIRLRIRNHGF